MCSYGVNYVRLGDDFLVAGIILKEWPTKTPARGKMLKAAGKDAVPRETLDRVAARFAEVQEIDVAALEARKDDEIEAYRRSAAFERDVVDLLRPDLERTLGQVHDYKQFIQNIVQNMNVIWETRWPGDGVEKHLEKASYEERAIYWAARLMDEKLDAALFLLYPERIASGKTRFRFHGMVTKYRKIYDRFCKQKGLTVEIVGESWGDIYANPQAVPVIPHALIDNATKYAPANSTVRLHFQETEDNIRLTVGSYGPIITPEEISRIFELFYRGAAARTREPQGTGFGLAAAQLIAKELGTAITVEQSGDARSDGTHWTEFSVEFDRAQEQPERRGFLGRGR